jgi:hypothetical protein
MSLTLAHIALIDILSDKVITLISTLKRVPEMSEEEVDAETLKWEAKLDEEVEEMNKH